MKNSNRYIRNLLIYNYGATCWLKGVISKDNPLTLHHIIPVRFGGQTTIENGALLTLERHQLFNTLEIYRPNEAEEVNFLLKEYKGQYPQIVDERVEELIMLMYDIKKYVKEKRR